MVISQRCYGGYGRNEMLLRNKTVHDERTGGRIDTCRHGFHLPGDRPVRIEEKRTEVLLRPGGKSIRPPVHRVDAGTVSPKERRERRGIRHTVDTYHDTCIERVGGRHDIPRSLQLSVGNPVPDHVSGHQPAVKTVVHLLLQQLQHAPGSLAVSRQYERPAPVEVLQIVTESLPYIFHRHGEPCPDNRIGLEPRLHGNLPVIRRVETVAFGEHALGQSERRLQIGTLHGIVHIHLPMHGAVGIRPSPIAGRGDVKHIGILRRSRRTAPIPHVGPTVIQSGRSPFRPCSRPAGDCRQQKESEKHVPSNRLHLFSF